MVKAFSKQVLVFVVVGLIVGYVLLKQSCGMERMTDGEDAVAAAQKEWDSFVKLGFSEANAKDNPAASAALAKLNTAKEAAASTSSGKKSSVPVSEETVYIVLGIVGALIGAVLLVILLQYAYRSLTAPPAYQASPYGARRR
jgi:glycerol uptake facilitator-like aquaporin